jgi:hypothetical protein
LLAHIVIRLLSSEIAQLSAFAHNTLCGIFQAQPSFWPGNVALLVRPQTTTSLWSLHCFSQQPLSSLARRLASNTLIVGLLIFFSLLLHPFLHPPSSLFFPFSHHPPASSSSAHPFFNTCFPSHVHLACCLLSCCAITPLFLLRRYSALCEPCRAYAWHPIWSSASLSRDLHHPITTCQQANVLDYKRSFGSINASVYFIHQCKRFSHSAQDDFSGRQGSRDTAQACY